MYSTHQISSMFSFDKVDFRKEKLRLVIPHGIKKKESKVMRMSVGRCPDAVLARLSGSSPSFSPTGLLGDGGTNAP